jgi:transposase-like protein
VRARDLADEDIRYEFMDGWYPKMRIGGRRERVPVLVTLGVRANGDREVLDMRLVGEEGDTSQIQTLLRWQPPIAGRDCLFWN